ncbi:Uncharacterised protein [Vibrio cholerae]|nr:Uncharacterised protein [Vibrio cholerae]
MRHFQPRPSLQKFFSMPHDRRAQNYSALNASESCSCHIWRRYHCRPPETALVPSWFGLFWPSSAPCLVSSCFILD